MPATGAIPGQVAHLSFLDFALYFSGGFSTWVILTIGRSIYETYKARQQTNEAQFDQAIASDNLEVLSHYLVSGLGSLNVKDYATKSVARERLDRCVLKLIKFVGTDTEIENQRITDELLDKSFETQIDDIHPEIAKARELVERGSVWTALAMLRRDLEQRMREMDFQWPLKERHISQRFGSEVGESFNYFQRIANSAIHGEDVDIEVALKAIEAASAIYRALE